MVLGGGVLLFVVVWAATDCTTRRLVATATTQDQDTMTQMCVDEGSGRLYSREMLGIRVCRGVVIECGRDGDALGIAQQLLGAKTRSWTENYAGAGWRWR